MRATILWFDSLSGEGLVRLENGAKAYLYFTAIEGVNKHNYHWPLDADRPFLDTIGGLECEVTLYRGQVDTLKFKSLK